MRTEWRSVKDENPDFKCRHCGGGNLRYYIDESSDGAHEDVCYDCPDCKHIWWVEGIDS